MTGTERHKQSLCLSDSMFDEVRLEAARCDRSLPWVV
jgi:uncharacterized small protein (TIGR04563 family)